MMEITTTVATVILQTAWSPVSFSPLERRRAGDIGFDPSRCRSSLHDIPNSLDGFVRQGLALVPGKVQLNIRGLAVGALRALARSSGSPQKSWMCRTCVGSALN